MNDPVISTMVRGVSTTLPDSVRDSVEQSVRTLSSELERVSMNRSTSKMLAPAKQQSTAKPTSDAEMFSSISEMVNGNTKNFAGFQTLLDSLYAKNKKYFTIIKDYEIMPILIPQINRVLSFLVNECLSPDIQNEETFTIKYTGPEAGATIQTDLDTIKKELKLDNLLREVYTNRYKLGKEYYLVQDYRETFDYMLQRLEEKRLSESTSGMADIAYFEHVCSNLIGRINEATSDVSILHVDTPDAKKSRSSKDETATCISEVTIPLALKDLNIVVERSSIVRMLENVHAEVIHESYSKFSRKSIMAQPNVLNEDATVPIDSTKMEQLVDVLKKKKLQRCTIVRLDPAKVFQLKVGGKIIGYFHISDINEGTNNMVNFAQSLKDQLLKSRATNLAAATQSAEEVIAKELATRILNTFDPNLGINRVEDIDLLHDFIRNNEVYKGNKRVTFYYEDEIFDMSRADGSILINAVFFTKLYSTLLLNNIVTKVLRGRGRQIHTVKIGVSPNVQRYVDNAMASLAMPEHNLGTLHGTFEQIMNPFNGASDIVIPSEDDEKYITTDYIPGQDVDMNDDFLKFLLSSIVSSFNLDSAVLDATNGNLQFARTLTMESLQISSSIKNEQQDLYDPWKAMCLEVVRIMGSADTVAALNNGQIEVKFFEPKSLIIQNTIDDINNVKNLAEAIADIIPQFNEEGTDLARSKFIYEFIKERCNLDTKIIDRILADIKIDIAVTDELEAKIREIVREMKENTREEQFGDTNGDGLDDTNNPEYSEGGEDTELTPEEQELADMPAEETEDEGDEL